MFSKRKWFVKDKLEPDEIKAAQIFRQEAMDDRNEALGGDSRKTQRKESLIPIKGFDPEDPSNPLIDSEAYKAQIKEATKEPDHGVTDDLIQFSLIDIENDQPELPEEDEEFRRTWNEVHRLVSLRLQEKQQQKQKEEETRPADLLSWSQEESICMGSIMVEEVDSISDSPPLPSKEELRHQLFGSFHDSPVMNKNISPYLIEGGVYEYEDENDDDSGCDLTVQHMPLWPRQAFQEEQDMQQSHPAFQQFRNVQEHSPYQVPVQTYCHISNNLNEETDLNPPSFQSEYNFERFQYITDNEDFDDDPEEKDNILSGLLPKQNRKKHSNSFLRTDTPEPPVGFQPLVMGTNPHMTTQSNLENFFKQQLSLPLGEVLSEPGLLGRQDPPSHTFFRKIEYNIHRLFEEILNYDLFKESISRFSILGTIGIWFLLLTIFIGNMLEAPITAIICLCVTTIQLLKSVGQSLYHDLGLFQTRRRYRHRLAVANSHVRAFMFHHTNDPPDLEGKKFSPPSGTDGLRMLKPDGVVSRFPRKKTILIEKIQISEVECKLIEDRPFIPILLGNKVEQMALVDSGAQCSSISPRLLAKLEEVIPVPREKKSHRITGVIPNAATFSEETVILSFKVSSGHEIRNIPFVVLDTGTDLLIGTNVIKGRRWGNQWQGDSLFYKLGYKGPSIEAYFLPSSAVKAITLSCLVLMPMETKMVPLHVPSLEGFKSTNLHKSDLIVNSAYPEDQNEQGIDITPCISRFDRRRKNKILVEVTNKMKHPVCYEENTEMASIQFFPQTQKDPNIFDISNYRRVAAEFASIPRVRNKGGHDHCHCKIERTPGCVTIQLADRYGLTSSTTNLMSQLPDRMTGVSSLAPLKSLEPGLLVQQHRVETNDPSKEAEFYSTVLVIPDKDGSYSAVNQELIKRTKNELEIHFKHHLGEKPRFYFLDPLTEISFATMSLMVDLHAQLKFSFHPVRYLPGHKDCVHMSMQHFPSEILAGSQATRLHIQKGKIFPPADLLMKDKDSPVFKTKILGASLFLFRLGIFLTCHLHLPHGLQESPYRSQWRDRILYLTLSELRKLRIPTDIQITIDGDPTCPTSKQEVEAYSRLVNENLGRLPSFLEPNEKCLLYTRETEEESVDFQTEEFCRCCICIACSCFRLKTKTPGVLYLYEGDLLKPRTKRDNVCGSFNSSRSSISASAPSAHAAICSFTAIDGAEFDIPLDPLSQVDEEELHTFMNTHPGFENDQPEEEENKTVGYSSLPSEIREKAIPLPQYHHRTSSIGIPDTFLPGNWRQHVNLQSMSQLPSNDYRQKLENLLDRYSNILSCHKTDCRPIYLDEKQVEVDIELTTDKPIFIKPYPMAEKMIKVLDAKIDEMLEKGEIVEIESPYNVPILLTHHNSENKHIDFENKKFRLCLDLRVVNSLTKFKNLHSHLVKGIEFLYARIKGMKVFTVIDMTKAYRSLIATEKLMQVCAFRTPGSTKYPFHTWAFRSTPDGLATLPGFYTYCIQKALSPRSRQCTLNHIDDLLVASPDWETHLQDLESVFSDLLKGNFLISVPKLKLGKTEISFLGHVINGEVLKIPEERKSYFDALEPPTTKKEMQSLLGVAGYMAHFVDSYHLKTGPLFEALRGRSDKQKFTLNEVQMKAFEELRQSVKRAENLFIVDFNKTIFMETDSSLSGTGSILYQEYEDQVALPGSPLKRRIIRYGSRRFSVTESLHHTSLEREAMGVLIGCKTHYFYLYNCPEAVIKTDLKSLITLLSCYNNPDSGRMSLLSHRLYSLPFRWSLTHAAGTDIPLADSLSRLYPPYRAAFSDRHLRYPDLKRENIKLPDEWKKTPNLILKTSDLLDAMRDQAVYIEKSSLAVKSKRLKALMEEVILLRDEIGEIEGSRLEKQISKELEIIEKEKENRDKNLNLEKAQRDKTIDTGPSAQIAALTSVSSKTMLTPYFFAEKQNENAKLNSIILHLRTTSPSNSYKKQITKKYRLLNDSILVTRKDRYLPFDAPGNLRIVCDTKMTLIILSFLHIMHGHLGINSLSRIFSNIYRTEGSVVSFAKIVCLGCRACRLHRPVFKKTVPLGRIPIPSEPGHTWHMDYVVWKQETTHKGKKLAAALNIVDLYSNLLISHLTPDQSAETTIKCLKATFCTIPAPMKIVSDNGPGLCINKKVATFLKSKGVQNITTITPYNSQGNKSERMHRILRETMKLVSETFHRKSIFDMYTTVVEMINSRPLTLSNHPYIRKALGGEPEVVTPFSLHYGQRPPAHPQVSVEDSLEEDKRKVYREKWQDILKEHDAILQVELDERNKAFKTEEGIQEGDLVLCINHTRHKEGLKYYRRLYEVTEIKKARYYLRPLFSSTPGITAVNGNDLKPYNYSELFELLPPDLRRLMGESLKPEDIKNMVENDPTKVPKDFQDWAFLKTPPTMALRKRLSPASLDSVPAVDLSQPGTMESSSDGGHSSENSSSQHSVVSINDPVGPFPRPPAGPSPFLSRRFGVPFGSLRPTRHVTSAAPPPALTQDNTSAGSTVSIPWSLLESNKEADKNKDKSKQANLVTTPKKIVFEKPGLPSFVLANRPAYPLLSTRHQQQLATARRKKFTGPAPLLRPVALDEPQYEISRPVQISFRKPSSLPGALPRPLLNVTVPDGLPRLEIPVAKKTTSLPDNLSRPLLNVTVPGDLPKVNLPAVKPASLPNPSPKSNTINEDPKISPPVVIKISKFPPRIFPPLSVKQDTDKTKENDIKNTMDNKGPAQPLSLPPLPLVPGEKINPSIVPKAPPPSMDPALNLKFDSSLDESDSISSNHKPLPSMADVSKRRTVFSDKRGFPIAIDNTGLKWRLSKRFTKDDTKPRHLPFDTLPGSDSSPSDRSSDQGVLPATSTPLHPAKPGPAMPQFPVTPFSQAQSTREDTTNPDTVTRSGRKVKPVTRFGSWDYGSTSPDGATFSTTGNEDTTTFSGQVSQENTDVPVNTGDTAKRITDKIMARLFESTDGDVSFSDDQLTQTVDSLIENEDTTTTDDQPSAKQDKIRPKQILIIPSLFKTLQPSKTQADLSKLAPGTLVHPGSAQKLNNTNFLNDTRKGTSDVFPTKETGAVPKIIPILPRDSSTQTTPTKTPVTSRPTAVPASAPTLPTRPSRQRKPPDRFGDWTPK